MVYIKEIKLKGFKSFGHESAVKFDTKFNCLIGPNGSGKSNIIDAILFVLGTRSSKSIRADNLKDLLYSGTGGNKPAEEAYVEIIFDNSDYAIPYPEPEISILRQINKSGQSTYKMNNKRLTRTEILDKLKLAGIDSVNGYNVIAQGQVAEIIGMSGENRRKLLEDIAGTASFDEKKADAIKGLEEAKRRLDELSILVGEIAQQHASMKAEKIRMEKFIELASEIKSIKSKIHAKNLSSLDEKLATCDASIEELKNKITELEEKHFTDKVTELNSLLEQYEKGVEDINFEIDSLKSELKSIELSTVRIEEELRYAKNEIASRKHSREQAQNQHEQLSKKIEKNKTREAELQGELENLTTEYMQLEQEIETKQDQLEEQRKVQDELFIEFGDKDREFRKYEQQITQINVKMDYGTSLKENYEKTLMQKDVQIENINITLNEKRNDLTRIKTAIDRTEGVKTQTQQDLERNEIIKKDLENQLAEEDAKLRTIEDETLVLKTQLKTIEDFMERSKNDPAYEFIMEQKNEKNFKGMYGKLSDFYKNGQTPKEVHHLAGAVVVENMDTAVKLIKMLKDKHVGATRFISKTAFGSQSSDSLEFVKHINERSQNANSIDDAAKKWSQNQSKIVVSVEGDIFYPDGTILGGYFSESAKEELETVQKRLHELYDLKSTLVKKKEELQKELQSLRSKTLELSKKIDEIQVGLTNALKQEGILEQTIKQVEQNMHQYEQERFPLLAHIDDKIAELNDLKKEFERLDDLRKNVKESLDILKEKMSNNEIKAMEVQINESKRDLSRIENQQVRVEAETESIQRSLDEYSGQLSSLASQIEGNKDDLVDLEKLIENKTKESEDNKFKKDSLEDSIDEKKEDLLEAKMNLKKTKEEWESVHIALDQMKERIKKSQDEIHELEIEKQRYVVEKENIVNNAKEEQIELIILTDEEKENYSVKDLERKIIRLVEQQKSLEPINMKAGEEFDRLDKRYNELLEQREILQDEHAAIQDFITQIEAEKLNTFMRAFTAIGRHFSRIYAELSDGTGRMLLEKPDDVFNGGVEIEANPKGKKVRALESLSGGEKALCALSFIFAIQHVDAQPFYVLDEVDAALDPGNVDKLARKLLELSREGSVQGVKRKGAQFIVISHREILMAKSDLIWGVTSKNGLTQLWQMNLDDYQVKAKELGLEAEGISL
jgi:chromosome segregation protein